MTLHIQCACAHCATAAAAMQLHCCASYNEQKIEWAVAEEPVLKVKIGPFFPRTTQQNVHNPIVATGTPNILIHVRVYSSRRQNRQSLTTSWIAAQEDQVLQTNSVTTSAHVFMHCTAIVQLWCCCSAAWVFDTNYHPHSTQRGRHKEASIWQSKLKIVNVHVHYPKLHTLDRSLKKKYPESLCPDPARGAREIREGHSQLPVRHWTQFTA